MVTSNPTPESVVSSYLTPLNSAVRVVNICILHEAMYGEDYWTGNRDYDHDCADLKVWCSDHGASYYAAGREDFFVFKSIEQAKAEGNKFVVVEVLS